jgi:predicted TIM-barrel fold metal-dependent hydrolase
MSKGYDNAPPGGWDPAERIKDQETDGVIAEVLYATLAMPLFRLTDGDLQRECFRVYNDWMGEFCAYSPQRLIGNGLISLDDIALAVKELERCARLGLKGVMIWSSAPEDKPYDLPLYDPFWTMAQELKMPLSMHAVTGRSRESTLVADPNTGFLRSVAARSIMEQATLGSHEIQRTIMSLVYGGVMERFPTLKFVSVENNIGWIPFFLRCVEKGYGKYKSIVPNATPKSPSFYLKRQFYATFENDPIGMSQYQIYGEDNYMWASDYPHRNTTFPHSHKVIAENFAGLPDEVRNKIVHDNVVKLFNL